MLLRNSVSNTKKFFQRTLKTVKSFFSGSRYQKLPKTPPPFSLFASKINVDMNFHTGNHNEFDPLCTDWGEKWDSDKNRAKQSNEKETQSTALTQAQNDVPVSTDHGYVKKKRIVNGRKREEEELCCGAKREGRMCLVAAKLKELEMLDVSNVQHTLDIDEVFHYYSRLTCPAYLDIVDRFFMEMYSECFAFAPPSSSGGSFHSRPWLQPGKS